MLMKKLNLKKYKIATGVRDLTIMKKRSKRKDFFGNKHGRI